MRTHAEPNVERPLQRNAQPSAGDFRFASVSGERHVNIIAALGNPQPLRGGEVRLNLPRDRALLVAKLQRGQPARVQGHVDINRIGVQTLAQHQRRFLVLVSSLSQERDVGRQGHVSRHFLPHKLKGVGRKPHVFAAAADRVRFLRRIVIDEPGVQKRARRRRAPRKSRPCSDRVPCSHRGKKTPSPPQHQSPKSAHKIPLIATSTTACSSDNSRHVRIDQALAISAPCRASSAGSGVTQPEPQRSRSMTAETADNLH